MKDEEDGELRTRNPKFEYSISSFISHPFVHCTLIPATRSPLWLKSVE